MNPAKRQNIIILLSDQLRRDALGIYGDSNISTPNIDSLARRGVKFTNACSTYPVCVPFRFTLQTGQFAHTRSVPSLEWRMSPSERTMADEFNKAGYETIYIGKWHLHGHGVRPEHGVNSALKANRTCITREFQGRWQKWLAFELRNDPFDTCYFIDDDPIPHQINKYQTDGLYDLAMEFIANGRDKNRPFVCILSTEAPHPPFISPKDLQNKWNKKEITLPPNFVDKTGERYEEFKAGRRQYYAMVENLDNNVGRMSSFLKNNDLSDNTIIVFLSDHGELGGSHGLMSKQYPYEESIGIPLIVVDPSIPGRSGAIITEPLAAEDLFPTILGLANIVPETNVPGLNASPLIRGQKNKFDREGILLEFVAEMRSQFPFYEETWRGFRTKRYKYTVLGGFDGGRPWQFFDLESDPYELNNLIDNIEVAETVRSHHYLLRQALIKTSDSYVLQPAFGFDGLNLWR